MAADNDSCCISDIKDDVKAKWREIIISKSRKTEKYAYTAARSRSNLLEAEEK
jgi:hypothetical protein